MDTGIPQTLITLAWTHYGNGNKAEAARLARQAQEKQPTNADITATLGWMAWENDEKDAEYYLHEALRLKPDHAEAHWYLGYIAFRRGLWAAAETFLRRALDLNPNNDDPALVLADVFAETSRLEEASALLYKATQSQPTADRFLRLGRHLLRINEDAAALVLLQHANTLLPKNSTIICHLASALSECGRTSEAISLISQQIKFSPYDRELRLRYELLQENGNNKEKLIQNISNILLDHPLWTDGWSELAMLCIRAKNNTLAEKYFRQAASISSQSTPPWKALAQFLATTENANEAILIYENILSIQPDDASSRQKMFQLLLTSGDKQAARVQAHIGLRHAPAAAESWLALAQIHYARGSIRVAGLAAQRALKHSKNHLETLSFLAVLNIEAGNPLASLSYCDTILKIAPEQKDGHILASLVHQMNNNFACAEQHAEKALALAPANPSALDCLAQLRHSQKRSPEAEALFRKALDIAPQRHDIKMRLAWVIASDHRRIEEALDIADKCLRIEPKNDDMHLQNAELIALSGRFQEAISCVETALTLQEKPKITALYRTLANLYYQWGRAEPLKKNMAWSIAATHAAHLLRYNALDATAGKIILNIQSEGSKNIVPIVTLIPKVQQKVLLLELLEWVAGFGNIHDAKRLTTLSRELLPNDAEIEAGCLYLMAMASSESTTEQISQWVNHHQAPPSRPSSPTSCQTRDQRLRIAYLASHYHENLLTGILSSHDETKVVLHLYTDSSLKVPNSISSRVSLHPIHGSDLKKSCQDNGIQIAIDTVGIHPFHGQSEVLHGLRQRLAPLQCGWFGSWGTGCGLFDALITDDFTLPEANAALYHERILKLTGGQWAWTPPSFAPETSVLPGTYNQYVTFACPVRSFRISDACLDAWIKLLTHLPTARLMLVGRHVSDWHFRHLLQERLSINQISADRITFRSSMNYRDYLLNFSEIDIVLDSFPANGGLSIVDALWMGVPVITLAGETLLSERQGGSILESANKPEWIAKSIEEYITISENLASDLDRLSTIRSTLRPHLISSPLLNPRRITEQMEYRLRECLKSQTF